MPQEKSLGEKNYEDFAHRYAEIAPHKAHNAHYERPATLALLPPELTGKQVLDAGCGPGIYTELLLERGATVTAFDVTPAFVEIAKAKVGQRASVLQADLNAPLSFAGDAAFDLVMCPLVLDYIADWLPVFQEFYRVLKPGGVLVFSCGHPFGDWFFARQYIDVHYFETQQFTAIWSGFGEPNPQITSYRRSMSATLQPLLESGFLLEKFIEPQPTEAFKALDPVRYEKLIQQPGFLCIRALKPA